MPLPGLPPTPAASMDIVGEQKQLSKDPQSSFTLPPPAMSERKSPADSSSAESTSSTSESSYHPVSPSSPAVKAQNSPRHKRTASGAKKPVPKEDFNLPPPPSRTRKIIQVQPKPSVTPGTLAAVAKALPTSPPSKRKTPSASSVAGRKIARRTAHSIIERRRRSKMNEEFDTLKNMIPACEGQDMHKLAILQASIEYTRYLQDCVKDLKQYNNLEQKLGPYPEPSDTALAPPFLATQGQYRRPSTTPSIDSPSVAVSASSSQEGSIADGPSAAPTPTLLSPAFHAIQFSPDLARQIQHSNQTSPNILPQAAIEIDATAALMMLTNDRRGLGKRSMHDVDLTEEKGQEVKRRPTGMSVRDLLTS